VNGGDEIPLEVVKATYPVTFNSRTHLKFQLFPRETIASATLYKLVVTT